ncbi:MAG: DEAD/DEAH box helicase family protein [Melioribacteraceae bacterium]|nr:DEAD/DEAH box helicase family protein [Melioribacteraceae bacterium]
MKKIDKLIINSPYEEPQQYWSYEREKREFELKGGRRPAGYVIASESSRSFDDPGVFVPIPLVNEIRKRVQHWKENDYPGVTGITKKLLEHWYNHESRQNRFFFCQLEAIETLIWLTEAPENEKLGIDIASDGGEFQRLCSKMATGSGKTIVMAMLIAWQVLNKVTYPQDRRFTKNVFVVAPGLTVKNRLQVLQPFGEGNYYDEFNIVPTGLFEKLRQAKILIKNWHALQWDTEEKLAKKKSVDKRGAKSDEAYVREILEELSSSRNILVINDEAHHAWRIPAESKIKGVAKEDIEEATKWIGGLDRVHRAREILTCYDFSATPFTPTGKKTSEEALFGWIVSDFGLNDAIESGLVKTPRVVVRDDALPEARTYKPKLYHIYEHVRDELNRKAKAHEPLPDLVVNGYYLLGKDWLDTYNEWNKVGFPVPPVMITVANRTETAARIKHALDRKKIRIDELCDSDKVLHIDSKVLSKAESQEEEQELEIDLDDDTPKLTKNEQAEFLRQQVDTVGQVGKPGEQIRKVISVGMLSEGWDAKTVTHIMGLRAFTSQLLCEQVVGRGLRRTSYDVNKETGLLEAEHVNIFGVPFTFLPHEENEGTPPPPPRPKTAIEPVNEKLQYQISWPNVLRIDHEYKAILELDVAKVKTLKLNAYETSTLAELAPVVEGRPNLDDISLIDLQELAEKYRMQRIVFETARDIFDQMNHEWKGNREDLIGQLIRVVDSVVGSNVIEISPPLFNSDDIRRRLMITLNMNKVVNHIWRFIRQSNSTRIIPVFDTDKPIRSTGDMRTWFTSKPCDKVKKSHINFCVFDSTWESSAAVNLDRGQNVVAWVKNDHLGFQIPYVYQGIIHNYLPDYLIKLKNDTTLILEVKGEESQQDKVKGDYLKDWCMAINEHGGFGKWVSDVAYNPDHIIEIIAKHCK